jgi:purine-nucleoside phosphorylase
LKIFEKEEAFLMRKGLIHLKFESKDLAESVLLPGDPLRAKFISEEFLSNSKVINEFRGLLSYTGEYKSIEVSVVTTGMGCPSAAIVIEELIKLGAKYLIRVGTCGGVQKNIQPGDLIIPTGAVPLAGILNEYGISPLPPVPDFEILNALVNSAKNSSLNWHLGIIATSDAFYKEISEAKEWENKNILAFEMECAAIFGISYLKKIKAGAILAATGNILYGEQVMETDITQKAIKEEIKIALEAIRSLK